jgi:hypothetical protein
MASFSTRKQCANGNGCKQMAAALCEGCSQALCTKHFIDHRRFLGEEMNVIISEHDQLQHAINQQTTNLDSHSLMKKINEWEKESIAKIQQKAKELRQEFHQFTTDHFSEITKQLRYLSEKLTEGREYDSFVETDLQDWKKSLDKLKENVVSPSTLVINRHDEISLVQDVSLNLITMHDIFERVFGSKVQINENGQVAIHDASYYYTEIRGKKQYTSDRHEVRLCIEESANSWTFLGINSKSTPLQNNSCNSKSAYGWTSNNCLCSNGSHRSNTSASSIEMKTNDIITLIFNCDTRKISMINQRTNRKHELDVNLDNCPFPWQLHVILYEPNSRVRILSTSS